MTCRNKWTTTLGLRECSHSVAFILDRTFFRTVRLFSSVPSFLSFSTASSITGWLFLAVSVFHHSYDLCKVLSSNLPSFSSRLGALLIVLCFRYYCGRLSAAKKISRWFIQSSLENSKMRFLKAFDLVRRLVHPRLAPLPMERRVWCETVKEQTAEATLELFR